jgi:hypothetical protein
MVFKFVNYDGWLIIGCCIFLLFMVMFIVSLCVHALFRYLELYCCNTELHRFSSGDFSSTYLTVDRDPTFTVETNFVQFQAEVNYNREDTISIAAPLRVNCDTNTAICEEEKKIKLQETPLPSYDSLFS